MAKRAKRYSKDRVPEVFRGLEEALAQVYNI